MCSRACEVINECVNHVWRSARDQLCAGKESCFSKKVNQVPSLQSKHGKQCRDFPSRDSLQRRAVRHGRDPDLFHWFRRAQLDEMGRDCAASIPHMPARRPMDDERLRLLRCCGLISTAKRNFG